MYDFSKLTLGIAPTRRDIFPNPDKIVANKNKIMRRIEEIGSQLQNLVLVDIDDVIEDGILIEEGDVDKIAKYFRITEIDALFVPHANFGQEESVAKLAKKLNVPVLLWGPRDGSPDKNEKFRTFENMTDAQCGMFATSRALLRYGVPFTYIENCWLDSPVLEKGIIDFVHTASVVKAFRHMRVLQLSNRPRQFLSVKVSEGELLEKFAIEVTSIENSEVIATIDNILNNKKDDIKKLIDEWAAKVDFGTTSNDQKSKMAAIELGVLQLAEKYNCNTVSSECWKMYSTKYGISPCFAFADLTDKGLSVACENDINGAVSSAIAQAAARGVTRPFFADITVRHPYNDNAELLWHCGPFPPSLAKNGKPVVKQCRCAFELMPGDSITLTRFDGDRGRYVLFADNGKTVEGPETSGSYVWFGAKDWPAWEKKLMYGPYIHHIAGLYGDYKEILREATKYMGVEFDSVE